MFLILIFIQTGENFATDQVSRQPGIDSRPTSFIYFVMLNKLCDLSEPKFSHVEDTNSNVSLTGLL